VMFVWATAVARDDSNAKRTTAFLTVSSRRI
jgi:hypothetical protein